MSSSETELAWAAGFFDGEGCTSLDNGRRTHDYPTLRITVSQKGEECLERFRAAVGGDGNITSRPQGNDMFTYVRTGPKACEVLRRLWPYLSSSKRAQAERVLVPYNSSLATRRSYAGRPRKEVLHP